MPFRDKIRWMISPNPRLINPLSSSPDFSKANGAARKPAQPLGLLLHVLSHRHFPRLPAVINTIPLKLHLCSPLQNSFLSERLRAFSQRWLLPRATWQRTSTSSKPPPHSPPPSTSRTAVFPPLRCVLLSDVSPVDVTCCMTLPTSN